MLRGLRQIDKEKEMREVNHVFLGIPNKKLDRGTHKKVEDLRKMMTHLQIVSANENAIFNIQISEWFAKSSNLMFVDDSHIQELVDAKFPQAHPGLHPFPYPQLCYASIVSQISQDATNQLHSGLTALIGFTRTCRPFLGTHANTCFDKILNNNIIGEGNKIIRVTGRPGVGKTHMVSRINNHALQQLSYKVIWAGGLVSLCDLQLQIANQMSLDLSSAVTDVGRASILLEALSASMHRHILVVLDLWTKYSRAEIGIPSSEKGYIVVIICRTEEARHSFASTGDKVEDLEISSLSDIDAMNLFCEIIGRDDIRNVPEETYRMVLDECDCLPSLISNLGNSIKKHWLETNDIGIAITLALPSAHTSSASLQDSYNILRQTTRPFFFYCALFLSRHNNSIVIEDLVWCWVCDGFQRGDSVGLVHHKNEKMTLCREMLKEMENAYLLEIVHKKYIKMSENVRKFAAQRNNYNFFIKVGNGNRENLKLEEDMEKASVMSDQLEQFGKQIMKNLTTLVVRNQNKHNQLVFPSRFFSYVPSIKVLDLSGTHLESFPRNFTDGKNLVALFLRGCPNLTYFPNVFSFSELLVLDLSQTRITSLPKRLSALKRLIHLNISDTLLKDFPFPNGLLNTLTSLRELLMLSSYLWKGKEGEQALKCVTQLTRFEANFYDLQAFKQFVDHANNDNKIAEFRLCIGKFHVSEKLGENTIVVLIEDIHIDRDELMFSLPLDNALHLMFNDNLKFFPLSGENTTILTYLTTVIVSDCGGLEYLFTVEMFKRVPNVEKIVVRRCPKMVVLIQQFGGDHVVFLPKVKELVFFQLEQFQRICDGTIMCKFLKSISVWECDKFKNVPLTSIDREGESIQLRGDKVNPQFILHTDTGMYKLIKSSAPTTLYSLPTYAHPKVVDEDERSLLTTILYFIFCFILMMCSFYMIFHFRLRDSFL